jgi:transporter family protein
MSWKTIENPLLLFERNDAFARFHVDIASKAPPAELYHYTTSSSLLSIVNSQYMLATERSYVNDPEEFQWGLKAFQGFLDERGSKYAADFREQAQIALSDKAQDDLRLFLKHRPPDVEHPYLFLYNRAKKLGTHCLKSILESAMADKTSLQMIGVTLAALTAIFAKVGVEQVSPDVATLLRTVVILVAMTLLVLGTRQFPALFTASPRSYAFLLLSGLATGASWWCYFRALQAGDAARVAPLDKLSVVLVAIFGVGVLGERLAPLNWLGVVLVALGAWCVTLKT